MDPVLAQLAALRGNLGTGYQLVTPAPTPMLSFPPWRATEMSPSFSAARTQGALDALTLLATLSTDASNSLVYQALLANNTVVPSGQISADLHNSSACFAVCPPGQARVTSPSGNACSIASSTSAASHHGDLSVSSLLNSELQQPLLSQQSPASSPAGLAAPKQKRYWSEDEHGRFLLGLQRFGSDHKAISEVVGTRTIRQVRSHSQKFFLKIQERASKGQWMGGPLPDMSRKKKKNAMHDVDLDFGDAGVAAACRAAPCSSTGTLWPAAGAIDNKTVAG